MDRSMLTVLTNPSGSILIGTRNGAMEEHKKISAQLQIRVGVDWIYESILVRDEALGAWTLGDGGRGGTLPAYSVV